VEALKNLSDRVICVNPSLTEFPSLEGTATSRTQFREGSPEFCARDHRSTSYGLRRLRLDRQECYSIPRRALEICRTRNRPIPRPESKSLATIVDRPVGEPSEGASLESEIGSAARAVEPPRLRAA